MSFSVQINVKDRPLSYMIEKKVDSWLDDNLVTKCCDCNRIFSLMVRKHHCRLCGKIYCYECSKYRCKIPSEILPEESKKSSWFSTTNQQRVCKTCNNKLDKIAKVKSITDVFTAMKLDIGTLKLLGRVSKLWNDASNYCQSMFRETQYKLPMEIFTPYEKEILWINASYYAGHSSYCSNLIKIATNDSEIDLIHKLMNSEQKINCDTLMCSKCCRKQFCINDTINILSYHFRFHCNNEYAKKYVISLMSKCSNEEIKLFMPLLTYNLRYDGTGVLANFMITKCFNSTELLNYFYWELLMYPEDVYPSTIYSNILIKLKTVFSGKSCEKAYVKLLQGESFIKIVDSVYKSIADGQQYEDVKDNFKFKHGLMSPFNVDKIIKNIKVEDIQIKNSATKPIIIPCEVIDGSVLNILYKNENVRKDQIVMNIINLIDILVKTDEGIDLELIKYNVLPTSRMSGIVEIVEKSDTLYFIQEKIRSSILNYILEKNTKATVGDIRDRFIKTTAAYTVITYILGIGDRHLDNIMVTMNGHLFHIDYGYILGEDPVLGDPGIRITPQIVEAIGGLSSVHYRKFQEMCSMIYNCLRRNMEIIINMILIIPKITDIKMSDTEIKQFVIRRFKPGQNNIDAKLHLVNQFDNTNTFYHVVKDWAHYHNKERTINSAIARLTTAITSLW